jgi:hypothetical protein
MDSVKFVLSQGYGYYSYQEASNVEMNTLGMFLSNMGCDQQRPTFKDWALANKNIPGTGFTHTIGTNATFLEEDDNGNIHLVDDTGSDPDDIYYIPARIIMTREQFIKLLDDWQEKVCKRKPREVIIKYTDDKFTIETKQ